MRLSAQRWVTVVLAALALAACSDDEGGGGVVSIESVDGTDVLADSSGRTLYRADVEKGGRVLCVDRCTSYWDPVSASAGESEAAGVALDVELGVLERPDGGRQLTLMGQPLYRFTEEGPGELTGDGSVDEFAGTRFEWLAATPGGAAATEPQSSPLWPLRKH
jgi:predicted lipoprotein with Yx(FWY)xxD motif